MKIVSGNFRGYRVQGGKVPEVKPTQGNIREAFFNILSSTVEFSEIAFLDLFCGFGGNGLEAMSRGAKSVTFVDQSSAAIKYLRQNLTEVKDKFPLDEGQEHFVLKRDALSSFKFLGTRKVFFDVVFLDPPYDTELAREVSFALLNSYFRRNSLLNKGFIVGLEWTFNDNRDLEEDLSKTFRLEERNISIENRKYGSHSLLILKAENQE